MYTEAIIERLNNPHLKPGNPGYEIIDGCVGEYLEHYDNHIFELFLTRATGGYLDLHAKLYGLYRRDGEDDDSLRQRVLMEEFIVQSTEDFLKLDIGLWIYFTNILNKNVLSSRNPYLKNEHTGDFIFLATGTDTDYVKRKFLINDVKWVD